MVFLTQSIRIMKNWKVYSEYGVTMAMVFSKCLRNTYRKIPHKILGRVMKLTQRGGGGGHLAADKI